MCGIAGILVAPNHAAARHLTAIGQMSATLAHRGPDAEGIWIDPDAGIALGHRRLSIVDLSEAGHQPMHSHGGDFVATYNGEIYNFPELRSELEVRGCQFGGHSDTEIMLAAIEAFGIEPALKRFAGMFALGLWDRRNRVLHLVRDRMGKKPLYVALVRGALLFASELKAFRAFPGFEPEIDPAALALVLRHGWVPDQYCIWKGVFKLPPGTVLSLSAGELAGQDAEQLRRKARPWWSLAEVAANGQAEPSRASDAEQEEELDGLLRLAVRQRMLADVPVGAFLSGGIDSTAIVALMQAQSPRPVRTFTVGFEEPGYNEAGEASAVARHLGTEHTELHLTPSEAAAVIPELPRIWDEPFAAESQIATFLVARLARRSVTVALSGDGGDECFGGYLRHIASPRLERALGVPMALRRPVAAALQRLSPDMHHRLLRMLPSVGAAQSRVATESLEKIARVLSAVDERELYRRLTSLSSTPVALAPDVVGADSIPKLPDLLGRLIYRDMSVYLPGNIFVKLDRATMACSLEGRCPFLDHRVVEFAWRLPAASKVRGGKGKWLLRRVLRRYAPEELFERPKSGFNVPIGRWLRGPLREWAEHLLSDTRLRQQGLLDAGLVQARWRQHLSGQTDRGCEIWAILMVQAWLDAQHSLPVAASNSANDSGFPNGHAAAADTAGVLAQT
jgi:asparagine synthase (glutamine-hydrolysing)